MYFHIRLSVLRFAVLLILYLFWRLFCYTFKLMPLVVAKVCWQLSKTNFRKKLSINMIRFTVQKPITYTVYWFYLQKRIRRWKQVQYLMPNTCSFQNLSLWCLLWLVDFACAAQEEFPRWCLLWQYRNWSCGHCGTRKRIVEVWDSVK